MKTTEEKNRMIAEFMGKEIYQKYHESLYRLSWNWLMPVVKKINSLATNSESIIGYFEKHCPYNSMMWVANDVVVSSDIKDVYHEVVRFIEWYNENKKED